MRRPELNLGIFFSGRGSTMQRVFEADRTDDLGNVRPVLAISSRRDAKGLTIAEAFGIKTYVIERKKYDTAQQFGQDLLAVLHGHNVDIVAQLGWIPQTPESVVKAYSGNMLNMHGGPLDPGRAIDFGGKGMHGSRITAARLAYVWTVQRDYWTEATVHHVTEEFDKGSLIAVSRMDLPQLGHDITVAELIKEYPDMWREATLDMQSDLLPREHELVISTLQFIGAGNMPSFTRPEQLVPPAYIGIAEEAKIQAGQLFPHG